MNPPLRTKTDADALLGALRDGAVDTLATDHAPHTSEEKALSRGKSPLGVIGLETALGAMLSQDRLDPILVIRLFSTGPARLWRRRRGTPAGEVPSLRPPFYGSWERRAGHANLTVIDPDRRWTVDPSQFYSKGRNSPFAGAEFRGRAVMTIVRGRIVMYEGDVI
jgi:dihydroorotase